MSCGAKDIANWTNFEANPEHEADEFASELLLPSAEMKSHIGTQWPSLRPAITRRRGRILPRGSLTQEGEHMPLQARMFDKLAVILLSKCRKGPSHMRL